MSNTSLLNLHNYYKNEIINRNRSEIIRFKNTQIQYDNLVEKSENMQKKYVCITIIHIIFTMSTFEVLFLLGI